MNFWKLVLAATAIVLSASVNAATISTSLVRSDLSSFVGNAFDSSSGKYYESPMYTSSQINVFNNKVDFESHTVASTITLQGGTSGTYFEVLNGKVYSRSDHSSSSVSVWDANTGVKLKTESFASMGGSNGTHTFNWGGYSGVNFMESQGDLYLFGKNLTSGWQVNQLDLDLNILSTTQYDKGALGYAFIVGDTLFSSDSFSSAHINSALDLLTGVQSVVDFTLDGVGSLYMTNLNYVALTDTLYLHDRDGQELRAVRDVSSALGVSAVPVPAAVSLFGTALIGLVGFSRRKSKVTV